MEKLRLSLSEKRRRQLLETAVESQSGIVRLDAMRAVYPRAAAVGFRDDCKSLQHKAALARELLAPLALPIPRLEYDRGVLEVPVRKFAQQLQSETENERKLARAIVQAKLGSTGDYLIPRVGSISIGIGVTAFLIGMEIIQDNEFKVSIFTTSFEIAAAAYFALPARFAYGERRLSLPGLELDWKTGSLRPTDSDAVIDTAIVGFDSMSRDGRLYLSCLEALTPTNRMLEVAKRRILLVGSSSKLANPVVGGGEIFLPKAADSIEILLVTDQEPPQLAVVPPNVTVLPLAC